MFSVGYGCDAKAKLTEPTHDRRLQPDQLRIIQRFEVTPPGTQRLECVARRNRYLQTLK
jgi:hypothetical protein